MSQIPRAELENEATTQQQLCKAWVRFDGTGTVAIDDSYNVSSITDNGTGDYTVNFTTALSNANYCVSGTVWNTGNDGSTEISTGPRGVSGMQVKGTSTPSTANVRIEVRHGASSTSNGANVDLSGVYVQIFGDS